MRKDKRHSPRSVHNQCHARSGWPLAAYISWWKQMWVGRDCNCGPVPSDKRAPGEGTGHLSAPAPNCNSPSPPVCLDISIGADPPRLPPKQTCCSVPQSISCAVPLKLRQGLGKVTQPKTNVIPPGKQVTCYSPSLSPLPCCGSINTPGV